MKRRLRKSNLITVLYAVIAVSYGKENFSVYENIPFLLLSAWRIGRKKRSVP